MLSRIVSYRPKSRGCDGSRRPPLSRGSGSSGIESSIDKSASTGDPTAICRRRAPRSPPRYAAGQGGGPDQAGHSGDQRRARVPRPWWTGIVRGPGGRRRLPHRQAVCAPGGWMSPPPAQRVPAQCGGAGRRCSRRPRSAGLARSTRCGYVRRVDLFKELLGGAASPLMGNMHAIDTDDAQR